MRINKFLAMCGLGSRRKCEEFVTGGRVKINGRVATNLALDINPQKDIVMVDGQRVSHESEMLYFMLNKPKGYVTTMKDEHNRPTVMDLVKLKDGKRVFPVGRLDYDTEGLLLFTNDGDLANALTHPSKKVPKTYVARIKGVIENDDLIKLSKGVELDDGENTMPCKVRLLEFDENSSRVEIVITEGKNRQVRRMFEAIGKEVEFLKRTQIGPIRLGGLTRGKFRPLKKDEIRYLKDLM